MFRLIKYSIQHPISILMGVLLLSILGGISIYKIPVEVRPQTVFPKLSVQAYWGKTSSKIVQQSITTPLESIALQVRDVRNVESTSGLGFSRIILEFQESKNLDIAYLELGEKLTAIIKDLPGNVHFEIEKLSDEQEAREKRSFFSIELSGPNSLQQLRLIAEEKFLAIFKSLAGVSQVKVIGGGMMQILVELDPLKARYYRLNSADVWSILQKFSQRQGLGYVSTQNERAYLLFEDMPDVLHDIRQISIAAGVKLNDVASIEFYLPQPNSLSRYNFEPLVSIHIYKAPGYHTLKLSNAIQDVLASEKNGLPPGVSVHISHNEADMLIQEFKSLGLRAGLILGLILIILLLFFREIRSTLLIFLSIFFAFVFCGIGLHFSGLSVNIVMLSGLALALGMLVDNSIVVVENIKRQSRERRFSKMASFRGTAEVIRPLFASVLTTLVVFLLFLFFTDRLSAYFVPLAYSIAFALSGSFILSLTLTPAAAANVLSFSYSSDDRETSLEWYGKCVRWMLHQRYLAIMALLLFGSFSVYLFVSHVKRGAFIHWENQNELIVYVDAPKGIELSTIEQILTKFEEQIHRKKISQTVETVLYENEAYGIIRVTFPNLTNRDIEPYLLKERFIAQALHYAGVGIRIGGFGLPYSNGGYALNNFYNTKVSMTGGDYERLMHYSKKMLQQAQRHIRVNEGQIFTSKNSYNIEKTSQFVIRFDDKQLHNYHFTIQELLNQLELAIKHNYSIGKYRLQNRNFDLLIKAHKDEPELQELKNLLLYTSKGEQVHLQDIATITKRPMRQWIDRKNQRYRFTVAWEFRGSEELRADYEKAIIENANLPTGYTVESEESRFISKEEEEQLISIILLAVLAIFMILASLYESFLQPLIILFSIPFALIGVSFVYFVAGRNFDVNAYIGTLLVMGIVVNNSIILVDHINLLRKRGMILVEAIIQGARDRIRPICITTLTTVGGLVPLIIMETTQQKSSELLQGLSFATVGGLTSSTILTVGFIPVFYYGIETIRNRYSRRTLSKS